jgi:hypothetical protein
MRKRWSKRERERGGGEAEVPPPHWREGGRDGMEGREEREGRRERMTRRKRRRRRKVFITQRMSIGR